MVIAITVYPSSAIHPFRVSPVSVVHSALSSARARKASRDDGANLSSVSSARRTHRMPRPTTASSEMTATNVTLDVRRWIAKDPKVAASAVSAYACANSADDSSAPRYRLGVMAPVAPWRRD